VLPSGSTKIGRRIPGGAEQQSGGGEGVERFAGEDGEWTTVSLRMCECAGRVCGADEHGAFGGKRGVLISVLKSGIRRRWIFDGGEGGDTGIIKTLPPDRRTLKLRRC